MKMLLRKRLFVGGLFAGVTKDDLVGKLRRFGNVISVEIKQVRNEEIVNTFAFVDIDITEDNLPKCIQVYSNTLWKGKEFFIQVAKESFLSRLKREQAEKQLQQDKFSETSLPSQTETVSGKLTSHSQAQASKTISNNENSPKKVIIQQDITSQNKRKRTKFDSTSESESDEEEKAVCRGLPMFKGLQNTINSTVSQCNSNNDSESEPDTNKQAPNIPLKSKRKTQHHEKSSDNTLNENPGEFSRPATSILDRLENFSSVWRNDNDDDNYNTVPLWKTNSKHYKSIVSRTNQGEIGGNEETNDLSYKKKKKKLHLNDEGANNCDADRFTSAKYKREQSPNEIPLLKNKLKQYKNAVQDMDEDNNYKDVDTHFSKKEKKIKKYRTNDTNEAGETSLIGYKKDKQAHMYKNSSEQNDAYSPTKKKKSKHSTKDSDDSSFANNCQREETFQTTKDTSTNAVTKRHEESNRKRIETLKQKQALLRSQKNAIKLALRAVDSSTTSNKKILFEDEEETDNHNDKVWDSSDDVTSKNEKVKPKSSMTLFEDEDTDEESSTLPTFEHKPLYESAAGQKLLELESRFGGDDRFKMNENFLEDSEDEDNENVEDTNEDAELRKEKEKNIELLSTILGDISPEKSRKSFHFKDMQALRYDPEVDEHEKFEIKLTPKTAIKKKKKQLEEEEKPLPEVTSERFYEVVPDLKQLLTSDASSFSLLKTFANEITDEDKAPPCEDSEKEISKETTTTLSQGKRFKYDSSDEEDAFTERTRKKFIPNKNNSSAEDQNSKFFFAFGDPRLKEGVTFFQQKESSNDITFSNWKEIRHQLNKNAVRKGKASVRKRLSGLKRKRNHRF